jgi:hypothetical protein
MAYHIILNKDKTSLYKISNSLNKLNCIAPVQDIYSIHEIPNSDYNELVLNKKEFKSINDQGIIEWSSLLGIPEKQTTLDNENYIKENIKNILNIFKKNIIDRQDNPDLQKVKSYISFLESFNVNSADLPYIGTLEMYLQSKGADICNVIELP